MPEPTPTVTGEALELLLANKLQQRNGNTENIAGRKREIEHYERTNVKLQAEIDAIRAAVLAGQPFTPPT